MLIYVSSASNSKLPLNNQRLARMHQIRFPLGLCPRQWRSRTFGRPVRWSHLPPFRLRFWKLAVPSRGGGKVFPGPRCLAAPPSFKILQLKKVLQIASFWPLQICINSIFGRGHPAGGAYDTPRTNRVVRGQWYPVLLKALIQLRAEQDPTGVHLICDLRYRPSPLQFRQRCSGESSWADRASFID